MLEEEGPERRKVQGRRVERAGRVAEMAREWKERDGKAEFIITLIF